MELMCRRSANLFRTSLLRATTSSQGGKDNASDCYVRQYLNTLFNSTAASSVTQKSYEEIPTAAEFSLPFVGQGLLLKDNPWKNLAAIRAKQVPPNIDLLRLCLPILNPIGKGRVVYVFQPEDVKKIYQNDNIYPSRGPFLQNCVPFRELSSDLFSETLGLTMEEGNRWYRVRTRNQNALMRPQSILPYEEPVQQVASDFTDYVAERRDEDGCLQDFMKDAHKWSWESVTQVALDNRLGLLSSHEEPQEAMATLAAIQNFILSIVQISSSILPWWKYVPYPRLSPLYRKVDNYARIITHFIEDQIESAIKSIENRKNKDNDNPRSVLEHLIAMNDPGSTIPMVMIFDMMVAGIDTTGNTLGFLLYNLSRNPEKQELLRRSLLPNKDEETGDRVMKTSANQSNYFKACLKESMRLLPTIPALTRIMDHDIELHGFHIPQNTLIVVPCEILAKDEMFFPSPNSYMPERWLRNDESQISSNLPRPHPSSLLQFSFGPRMCVGKLLAELELKMVVTQLLRRFRIEWAGKDEEDVKTVTNIINIPDRPLRLRFSNLD